MDDGDSLRCPECFSSDVRGSEDEQANAAGFCECAACGFAGLDDDFDEA